MILRIVFFVFFLFFLGFVHFVSNNSVRDLDSLDNLLSVGDFFSIATNKVYLENFYKLYRVNNEFDKLLFFIFLFLFLGVFLFFVRKFLAKIEKENTSDEFIQMQGSQFYLLFFLYFLLQFWGISFLGNVFYFVRWFGFFDNHSFVFSMFIVKLVILVFLFIFTPLLFVVLLILGKIFNFRSFLYNLMFFIGYNTSDFLRFVFLSVSIFLFFIFLGFGIGFDEKSLMVIYVANGFFYELLVSFIGLVLLVPLVEEIIFRAFLIKLLLEILGGSKETLLKRSLVIIVSSLVFSASHFESFIISFFIFIVGVFLAVVYLMKRSIIYTYVLHSIFNLCSLIFSLFYSHSF